MIVTDSMHIKVQATEDLVYSFLDEKKDLALLKITKLVFTWLFVIELNNNNWRFGYKNRTKRGDQLLQFLVFDAAISF